MSCKRGLHFTFFTFYFYLLLPSLNHLLKCLTGGAQVQLPLDTSCLCACVLYQISLFSSCMASSSGLFHSMNIFWPHRIQPASRADPRIPGLFKVGQERRQDRMYVWEGRVDIQKNDPRTSCTGELELLSHIGRNGTGWMHLHGGAAVPSCSHGY